MPTIEYRDFHGSETLVKTIDVRYTRRDWGGWHICRADNGRVLGWAVKSMDGKEWHGYVADGPFRGDDANDEGDVMDRVPETLTRRGNGWDTMTGTTRLDIAEGIVSWLCRQKAPALGFGRHYLVTRHHEDRPKLRAWYLGGMQGDMPLEG